MGVRAEWQILLRSGADHHDLSIPERKSRIRSAAWVWCISVPGSTAATAWLQHPDLRASGSPVWGAIRDSRRFVWEPRRATFAAGSRKQGAHRRRAKSAASYTTGQPVPEPASRCPLPTSGSDRIPSRGIHAPGRPSSIMYPATMTVHRSVTSGNKVHYVIINGSCRGVYTHK